MNYLLCWSEASHYLVLQKEGEEMKIYLATSWRNERYYNVKATIESAVTDAQVYDFRKDGFRWKDSGLIDQSDTEQYMRSLYTTVAESGFNRDMYNLDTADACVLLLPCGKSAHLEAGYAAGKGIPVAVLLSRDEFQPELMYKMSDLITFDLVKVCEWLKSFNLS